MKVFGKQVKRRNWLVAYTIPNGNGRCIMTSDDRPLTRQLVLEFEHWLQRLNPAISKRQPDALIFNIQPLDVFWETEKDKPHGIE